MIELPYPAAILSPNGRGHHMAKHRAFQKHKGWANTATLAARDSLPKIAAEGDIGVIITVYPGARRNRDRDNFEGRCKAYLDGIALALNVNDSRFDPRVQWAEPVKNPGVVITIEGSAL